MCGMSGSPRTDPTYKGQSSQTCRRRPGGDMTPKQKEEGVYRRREVLNRAKCSRRDRSHRGSEMYTGSRKQWGSLVTHKKPVSVDRGDGGSGGSTCRSSGRKDGRHKTHFGFCWFFKDGWGELWITKGLASKVKGLLTFFPK